jgi:hypothetical protein
MITFIYSWLPKIGQNNFYYNLKIVAVLDFLLIRFLGGCNYFFDHFKDLLGNSVFSILQTDMIDFNVSYTTFLEATNITITILHILTYSVYK